MAPHRGRSRPIRGSSPHRVPAMRWLASFAPRSARPTKRPTIFARSSPGSTAASPASTERLFVAVAVAVMPAQFVYLAHDRVERGHARLVAVRAARGQRIVVHDRFECDATARDAALDRAHRAPADFRRFLIGETAGADEDQRLALRLRQMQQRTLHVAELDMAILARRRGEDALGDQVIPLALAARAAHLREMQVAQDDEGPGAHVGTGLEALARLD